MAHAKPVLVGTDGSIRARYAVLEAARIARMYNRPLHILTAYSPLFAVTAFDPEPPKDEITRLENILRDSRDAVADRYSDLEVTTAWVVGESAASLVAESKNAFILVVGARGQGAVHRMLVGSVATKVATLAYCPVFVLRAGEFNPDGPITIGLPPEEYGHVALTVGFEHARVERTSVRVLRAHQHEAAGLGNMVEGDRKDWLRGEIDRSVLQSEDVFDRAAARYSDVQSLFVHIKAHATDSLIDASRMSRLVVVAPNGQGPEDRTLGSVALAVLHHAPAVLVAR